MAFLNEFRTQYPEYDDVDDNTLVGALHQKYRPDTDIGTFMGEIGYQPNMPQDAELRKRPEFVAPAPTHEERRLQERGQLVNTPEANRKRTLNELVQRVRSFDDPTPAFQGASPEDIARIGGTMATAPVGMIAGAVGGPIKSMMGDWDLEKELKGTLRHDALVNEGMSSKEAKKQVYAEGLTYDPAGENLPSGREIINNSNKFYEEAMGVIPSKLIKTEQQAQSLAKIAKPFEILFDMPLTWLEGHLANAIDDPEAARFIRNEAEAISIFAGPKLVGKVKGKAARIARNRRMKAAIANTKKKVAANIELQRSLPPSIEMLFAKEKELKGTKGVPRRFEGTNHAEDFAEVSASAENIPVLRRQAKKFEEASTALRQGGKLEDAMDAAYQAQFFREAAESAEMKVGKDFRTQKTVKNEMEYNKTLNELPAMASREEAVKFGSLYADDSAKAAMKRRSVELEREIVKMQAIMERNPGAVQGMTPRLEKAVNAKQLMDDAVAGYNGDLSLWDVKPDRLPMTFGSREEALTVMSRLTDKEFYTPVQLTPGEWTVKKGPKPGQVIDPETGFLGQRGSVGPDIKADPYQRGIPTEYADDIRQQGVGLQDREGMARANEARGEAYRQAIAAGQEPPPVSDPFARSAPSFGPGPRPEGPPIAPQVATGPGGGGAPTIGQQGVLTGPELVAAKAAAEAEGFQFGKSRGTTKNVVSEPVRQAGTGEIPVGTIRGKKMSGELRGKLDKFVEENSRVINDSYVKQQNGIPLTGNEEAALTAFRSQVYDQLGGYPISEANKFRSAGMPMDVVEELDAVANLAFVKAVNQVDPSKNMAQAAALVKQRISGDIKNYINANKNLVMSRGKAEQVFKEGGTIAKEKSLSDPAGETGLDTIEDVMARTEFEEAGPLMGEQGLGGDPEIAALRTEQRQQLGELRKVARDTMDEFVETELNPLEALVFEERIMKPMTGSKGTTRNDLLGRASEVAESMGKKKIKSGNTIKKMEAKIIEKLQRDPDLYDALLDFVELRDDIIVPGGVAKTRPVHGSPVQRVKLGSQSDAARESRAAGGSGIGRLSRKQNKAPSKASVWTRDQLLPARR